MAVDLDGFSDVIPLGDKLAYLLARDPAVDACLAAIYAERRRAFRQWLKDDIHADALKDRLDDLAVKREAAFSDCLQTAMDQVRRPDTTSSPVANAAD
jgi:hypothetical protein